MHTRPHTALLWPGIFLTFYAGTALNLNVARTVGEGGGERRVKWPTKIAAAKQTHGKTTAATSASASPGKPRDSAACLAFLSSLMMMPHLAARCGTERQKKAKNNWVARLKDTLI